MRQLYNDLTRDIAAEHIRYGMPRNQAASLAAQQAYVICSRIESGWPDEMLTVGMASWLSKAVKKVVKPFKKAAKFVEKKITRPIGKGIKHLSKEIEQHVIRPVAHWEYLSIVGGAIPGIGVYLGPAISAAQTARQLYVANKDSKKALREYEQSVNQAYLIYQNEALKAGVPILAKSDFVAYLESQGQVQTF